MAILTLNIKTHDGIFLPIERTHSQNTVKQIIDDAIVFLEYPVVDERQKEIEYFIENSKGEVLANESTLSQAGVKPGDVLTLRASNQARPALKQTSPPKGMVNVSVQLLDLSLTVPETFDMNQKAGEVLNEIIKKHNLPSREEKRRELKLYELFSKNAGIVMHEGMTLRDANIPDQDTFIVSTKEIPG